MSAATAEPACRGRLAAAARQEGMWIGRQASFAAVDRLAASWHETPATVGSQAALVPPQGQRLLSGRTGWIEIRQV